MHFCLVMAVDSFLGPDQAKIVSVPLGAFTASIWIPTELRLELAVY